MTKEEYIARIRQKYPYLEYCDVDDIYESAKENLLNAYDPFHNLPREIPNFYERKLLDIAYEIIDLGPMRNFTSYQENGCRITRAESLTSLNDITPYAG